jgi:leucyl-tRNA synthetase
VHRESWPGYEARQAAEKTVKLIIQVNGKTRGAVKAGAGVSEAEALKLALKEPRVQAALQGREPARVIYVPGRIINIVI